MAKSYKEKYQESYWRWMRNTDPEATELAMKWAEEHAEEMDQLDRMLFNNNQNFSRHNYPTEPSKLEYMEKVASFVDPDDYIPEDVLDRLYDDKRWFVRARYMPEGMDKEDSLYLPAELVEGLHELTELQREVLFRTVINGEAVASVAEDRNCSERNIRDIRTRAIEHLRKKTNVDTRGSISVGMFARLIALFALVGGLVYLVRPYLERIPEWIAIPIVVVALPGLYYLFQKTQRDTTEEMIRRWWDHLNTPKRED